MNHRWTFIIWLAHVVGVASVYGLLGRASHFLSIDPGHIVAVWLPAGISLAALLILGIRVWPGVWLGSFCFNLWSFGNPVDLEISTTLVLVSAAIGLGATLQAWVSAVLIDRMMGAPVTIANGWDVLKLMGLGGPLGCLISSTIAVAIMRSTAVIEMSNVWLSWSTWWMGDTIGVLIVTPLLLAGVRQPTGGWWRWALSVAVPVAAVFLISIAFFVLVRRWEDGKTRVVFEGRADRVVEEVRRNFDIDLEVLRSIDGLYRSSVDVTREEFKTFVEPSLRRRRDIQALEWIPRVPDQGSDPRRPNRAALVRTTREDGHVDFQILERVEDGTPVPAARRDEYFPVLFIEPTEGNEKAFGFDLASNPARLSALNRSRDSGEAVATGPVDLAQEQRGFLVFVPVYQPGPPLVSRLERRQALDGFAVGVYRIDALLSPALKLAVNSDLEFSVFDETDSPLLQIHPVPKTGAVAALQERPSPLAFDEELMLAERRWKLCFWPTPQFLTDHRGWQAWSVLAGGLLITALLEAFLLSESGRTTRIQKLVAQRTEALSESNAALERIARELLHSKQEAEAASRAKSDFLATMSHELRTPLNAILGYSYLMQQEARDAGNSAIIADLERIHGAGSHLLELISQVLDLSKIESGRMDLCVEEFELPRLLDEVVVTVAPLISRNGNTLAVHCDKSIPPAQADSTKIRQILLNLISNAAKFTKQGTVTVRVDPETARGRSGIRFQVQDSGIGIAPEQIHNVFEAFTQADSATTREYGGTGLGLAIVKRFCEMMDGSIKLESEPGHGSTFTVWLPTDLTVTDRAGRPVDQVDPLAGIAAGDGSTILVIDDDPGARDLLRRVLHQHGYGVETCANGREGLERARACKPLAITLDVRMPSMDGWSVLGALKADPELADTPTIMLTMVDDRSIGYALGATEYLTKPIDAQRLISVLNRLPRTGAPGSVLIVEDDGLTRDLMQRELQRQRWEVRVAPNGAAAVEDLALHQPDLIILDLMMPEMDGFEFLERIQHDDRWHSIPVVVITAKDLSASERERLTGHVAKILEKGAYQREELMDLVCELLDKVKGGRN